MKNDFNTYALFVDHNYICDIFGSQVHSIVQVHNILNLIYKNKKDFNTLYHENDIYFESIQSIFAVLVKQ